MNSFSQIRHDMLIFGTKINVSFPELVADKSLLTWEAEARKQS